jgi:uncharacterized membrane protein HdeD (DUF308 family)
MQGKGTTTMTSADPRAATARYLTRYYGVRALFSACWVALAFLAGRSTSPFVAALLLAYPAWDCLANLYDARRNGGLRANPTQAFNAAVSAVVTIAVGVAVTRDFHAVLAVIGVWAILSGLLQLATGIRRWRGASAQWPMILSGAQSSLAGTFFLKQAADSSVQPGIVDIAPYAAFGAVYFAISAIILITSRARSARPQGA